MADNYLEFSTSLDLISSDAEHRWLERQLENVEHEEGDMPRFLLDHPERGEGETSAGFEVNWAVDRVVFYAVEYGNVCHLAHLVQKFLREFRPEDAWFVTWAESCSKPRIGEFGGGAAFVTADEVRWMSAHQFIDEQLAIFQSARGRLPDGNDAP